jgi:hypothetical protein
VATVLRTWSYQYQWLYDGISRLAALSVGGETRFHQLPLQGLEISSDSKFLWLFETETSWQLLETDLVGLLKDVGFEISAHTLHAGGSLQVIQAKK